MPNESKHKPMQLSDKTRNQLLLQNIIYYLLLLGIAALTAWFSMRYNTQLDWSANQRNSLSESSREIVQQLPAPIEITVFLTNDEPLRKQLRKLIERYQRYKPDIQLSFIDPQTNPAKTRAMGITRAGEVIIEYQGKQQRPQQLNENAFTNALLRLARGETRWVVFLNGHNERDPYGQDDNGYSTFTERLRVKGISVQGLNLIAARQIPDNTHVLVIAAPSRPYLSSELAMISNYLQRGGNLLWLTDPEHSDTLTALATQLGIERLPGTVVDTAGQLYGVNQPDYVFIVNYTSPNILGQLNEFTLFAQAVGLQHKQDNPLQLYAGSLLQTLERSWNETGTIEGHIAMNSEHGEQAGPIDIGLSLQTAADSRTTQRIIVIGDSDFLANGFIGNGGNAQLGINLMNWLSHDDQLINIDAAGAPDTRLVINNSYLIFISILFLIFLPIAFIAGGTAIWLKRRKA